LVVAERDSIDLLLGLPSQVSSVTNVCPEQLLERGEIHALNVPVDMVFNPTIIVASIMINLGKMRLHTCFIVLARSLTLASELGNATACKELRR